MFVCLFVRLEEGGGWEIFTFVERAVEPSLSLLTRRFGAAWRASGKISYGSGRVEGRVCMVCAGGLVVMEESILGFVCAGVEGGLLECSVCVYEVRTCVFCVLVCMYHLNYLGNRGA